jgi:hypothetical protein
MRLAGCPLGHMFIKQASRQCAGQTRALVRKRATIVASILAFISATILPAVLPAKSYAWTSSPIQSCTTLHPSWSFTTWDWKSLINSNVNFTNVFTAGSHVDDVVFGNRVKTGLTSGYQGPASIIILQTTAESTNTVRVQFGQANGQSYYWKDGFTGIYGFTQQTVDVSSGVQSFNIDMSAHTLTASSGIYSFNQGSSSANSVNCIQESYNVAEGQFGSPQGLYTAVPPGSSRDCSGFLAIGCKVEDIFSGIADTFTSVGSFIVKGIATIFVPDGSMMSADWSAFYTTLTTKLGFLTYPFTFIGGVWTAFTTPTTTCCTFGSGTFLGGHFEFKINQWETTAPTLWTWLTAVIKGVTLLGLFFALRRKFLEVSSK